MRLTYLYHSGFAVEGEGCIVVIDYWHDPAGVLPRLLATDKPLYVLSSHFHEDHFNPDILSWQTNHANRVIYLLSKDILRHKRLARNEADTWLGKGASYQDERLHVRAFGSTDVGVSWAVELEGKTLFHAGDLNNWHWRDESTDAEVEAAEKRFLGELKDIKKVYHTFDVAMFPMDARMGSGYMRGAEQFVDCFHPRLMVPMHFTAGGFETVASFAAQTSSPFWPIVKEGESLTLG